MRAGRTARGWMQLATEAALILLACGLLQVLAERTNRRIDLTPTRALSLSPVTRNVLAEVTEPLRVTVFHRRGERARFAGLLDRLRTENPHVAYELFDLDRYPERARADGITQYGRAAIEYRGRRVVAPAEPEEQLVGGILQAVRGRRRRAVLTTGHGERVPSGDAQGVGRFVAELDAQGFTVDFVNLLDAPLPAEADLVIVAGPKRDFLPAELEPLARHLKEGGGVLMLLDPGTLPQLQAFLGSMGLALGDDLVVDRDRRVLGTDGLAAVVEQFRRGNPVSEPARNPIESGVVLPSARTVDVAREVPGVAAESIARTGDSAWAMADAERARRGEEPSKAARDVPGPLSVMVLAEVGGGDGPSRGRLAVVGDSDFATDAYFDVLGNRDVALNGVAWAGGEATLAGERPKDIPEVQRPLSPLVLTEAQARRLLATVAGVLPGIVLLAGIAVVTLRRRMG
jgi:gliding motility-associatede transport system auxiliary component